MSIIPCVLIKSETWTGHKLQGRSRIHGLNVSIENRKGSMRRGVDADGHEWSVKMLAPYGRIRGSVGADGDLLDVYVGPNPESTRVFIIHQNDPTTGKYDEDKVMLGFDSPEEAKALYLKQYDRPGFFGSMDETDIDTFKEKVMDKKNHGKKLVIRKARGNVTEAHIATFDELKEHSRLFTESELREKGGARLDKLIERKYTPELEIGILVEMEHTDDKDEAKRIALDHLRENFHYYTRLVAAGLVDEPEAIRIAHGARQNGTQKVVALDFDGVINSYKSGWLGEQKTDDPVPGAADAIKEMLRRGYKLIVFSARAESERGQKTIRTYLLDKLGIHDNQWQSLLADIEISDKKPIADVYIDDRAITFDGDWKATLDKVEGFKSWVGKSISVWRMKSEDRAESKRLVVPVRKQ